MAEKKQSVLSIKDCRFLEDKDPTGIYDKATLKRLYGIIAKLEKNRSQCSFKEKSLLRRFKNARFGYLVGNKEIAKSPLYVKGTLKIEGKFEGEIEKDIYGNFSLPYKSIGKLIVPSQTEINRNIRARSAKLRIAERVQV